MVITVKKAGSDPTVCIALHNRKNYLAQKMSVVSSATFEKLGLEVAHNKCSVSLDY